MKHHKTLAVAGTILLSLVLGLATAKAAEDAGKSSTPTGHQELFNGKDFAGWTFFMRSNAEPAKTWTITNGIIHCAGSPPGYLRPEKVSATTR